MKTFRKLIAGSLALATVMAFSAPAFADMNIFFPPGWKSKATKAKAIAAALSKDSGIVVKPRIAKSYPQILDAFTKDKAVLVYVGSFVQAILQARDLSVPIAQGINGREFYGSVLIAPKDAGDDPVALVSGAGDSIAFTRGASSGESGAKAASKGMAAFGTNNHGASVNAVKAGKAKIAFVKNWWWEGNKGKYPGMKRLDYPAVSDPKNPDNVLSANKAVSADDVAKIKAAAEKNAAAFGVDSFTAFDPGHLKFSLDLMAQGKIDPKAYSW